MHNIVRCGFNIIITVLFCPQLSVKFRTINRKVLNFMGNRQERRMFNAYHNSSGCGKVER